MPFSKSLQPSTATNSCEWILGPIHLKVTFQVRAHFLVCIIEFSMPPIQTPKKSQICLRKIIGKLFHELVSKLQLLIFDVLCNLFHLVLHFFADEPFTANSKDWQCEFGLAAAIFAAEFASVARSMLIISFKSAKRR